MTIIIPDIHELDGRLNYILTKHKDVDRRILLGDWFDSFFQPWQSFVDTVTLFQEACADPKNIMLMGNHDASYRYGGMWRCSGWSPHKQEHIRKTIKPKEWGRLKLWHREQGFLFSHAGLHPHVLQALNPPRNNLGPKVTNVWMRKREMEALEKAAAYLPNPLIAIGRSRGGPDVVGGITWLDWGEFEPIPGINQVVGHTLQKDHTPKRKIGENSENWCIDTELNHVGILEEGKFMVEDI